MLSALRAEVCDGCPSGRPYGTSLCTALAIHLVRRYRRRRDLAEFARADCPRPPSACARSHRRASKRRLSLTQLAALARLSSDHFAAQFRRSTGLPPHRYLLQRRIERAKELLAADGMSLAEIGYALGFPSQAHFTTTFRKLVGTTPGAYRDGSSHAGSEIAEEIAKPAARITKYPRLPSPPPWRTAASARNGRCQAEPEVSSNSIGEKKPCHPRCFRFSRCA